MLKWIDVENLLKNMGNRMDTKRIMILSGGFDPLHCGHIDMIRTAKEMADYLVVCVNSDAWLKKKKGINFLEQDERLKIISSLKDVDEAFIFEDDENGSALNGIKQVLSNKEQYQFNFREIVLFDHGEIYSEGQVPEIQFIFGNGGDRKPNSTPTLEQKFCEENGIELAWNLGGDKINSSSWILNRYKNWHFEIGNRHWGNYKVTYQDSNKKVKIIEVMPGKSLSLQTHSQRSEHWVVVEGVATVSIETDKYKHEELVNRNESIYVPLGAKHRLSNKGEGILQIVEVQIGDYLGEDDIIRYEEYNMDK